MVWLIIKMLSQKLTIKIQTSGTQFGDNTDYYLEQVYGIKISYEDIDDCDYDELKDKKIYPSVLNEYLLNDLSNEYCDWLEANKEKLGLTED